MIPPETLSYSYKPLMRKPKKLAFIGQMPEGIEFELKDEDDDLLCMAGYILIELFSLCYGQEINRFIVGLTPGIEIFTARMLILLKKMRDIRVETVLSYKDQFLEWDDVSHDRLLHIYFQGDAQIIVQDKYTKNFLRNRNRYIVDSADILFAVWDGAPESDLAWAVYYATRQNKPIVILDPTTLKIREL